MSLEDLPIGRLRASDAGTNASFALCPPFPRGKGGEGDRTARSLLVIFPSPSKHLARLVAGEVARRDGCDLLRNHHDARVRVPEKSSYSAPFDTSSVATQPIRARRSSRCSN